MNTQAELPLKKSVTYTRDLVGKYFFDNPQKGIDTAITPNRLHALLGENLDSVRQAAAKLFTVKILDRQRHQGTNEYEYWAGQKINLVPKIRGKRLPRTLAKRKLSPRVQYPSPFNATPPAGSSRNIGLTMNIGGKLHLLTINEAYSIYKDLMIFFNARGSHES